ncbi:N(4)-(Beta-N-acetylglucosaminyl)-L-asparaginase precursor [bacterium BMS3Abin04]|nr:N(4)-(Beta-N-acetylglucosaminyl)-L-asparaginase precursor [bacterium BMS3Abin04]
MEREWEKWEDKHKGMFDPVLRNHDTIGLLAMDKEGNIAGGVSTSGWANKMPGRVGDSPIIGAALYVDNEVGAACATGLGENVIKTAGSFLVVEKMREGYSPLEACKIAVNRLKKIHSKEKNHQVAYIALNKNGEHAGYSYKNGFEYAVVTNNSSQLIQAAFLNK